MMSGWGPRFADAREDGGGGPGQQPGVGWDAGAPAGGAFAAGSAIPQHVLLPGYEGAEVSPSARWCFRQCTYYLFSPWSFLSSSSSKSPSASLRCSTLRCSTFRLVCPTPLAFGVVDVLSIGGPVDLSSPPPLASPSSPRRAALVCGGFRALCGEQSRVRLRQKQRSITPLSPLSGTCCIAP